MNENDKLQFSLWLIERQDGFRAATGSRAATVISVNALLLAAATFLVDILLSDNSSLKNE